MNRNKSAELRKIYIILLKYATFLNCLLMCGCGSLSG